MNKTLGFKPHFIEAIIKKDKIVTTRLFDEKNLSVGDVVDLLNSENKEKFATSKITKVWETSFEDLVKDAKDVQGMYDQYKDYYNREIKPEDKVKWIEFELIK